MASKYALLLDGGFVTKELRKRRRAFPSSADVVRECSRLRGSPALAHMELLRIDWYDAPPATGILAGVLGGAPVILAATEHHRQCKSLHDALDLTDDFALRMGEVSTYGWRLKRSRLDSILRQSRALEHDDLEPNMTQKGVDLRIGLDIARLSLMHLVDVLVVVTGDSDLIPAFKFARREGLRVYLDHLGSRSIRRALKVHVDLVL